MVRAKWLLEVLERWTDATGREMETVAVTDENKPDPWGFKRVQAHVWWDGKRAWCHKCSGASSAMLTTCRHASAVRRARTKEATDARPRRTAVLP